MSGSSHLSFTVAGICTVGGLMGYVKGRSVPSLVAGLTFGALYGGAGYLIANNKDYGIELASAASALLALSMVPRAIRTRGNVPVGLAIIGVLTSGYYFRKLYQQTYGL
eukprot:jgi/Hompol1/884/HPOL_004018-RA